MCIRIEGSGLYEAWQEADLYNGVSNMQIINGNYYNRVLQAHQVTLQAFFDLWMGSFFEGHPALLLILWTNVEKLANTRKIRQGIYKPHTKFLLELKSLNMEILLHDFDDSCNE